MSDWYKEVREVEASLVDVAENLRYLAMAFYDTGNLKVSVRLNSMASQLDDARDNLKKSTSNKIDKDYKDAVESSANLLNTALRVAEELKNV